MFGMFRVVKYYLAVKKVGSDIVASFNSQIAIICPGGKLNNLNFQILLATGDYADSFTMVITDDSSGIHETKRVGPRTGNGPEP